MRITIKNLAKYLDIDYDKAKKIYRLIKGTLSSQNVDELPDERYHWENCYGVHIENIMNAIDCLIESYGVENVEDEDSYFDRFWFNTKAIYCNTGDTYNFTILYSIPKNRFYLTTLGDYLKV